MATPAKNWPRRSARLKDLQGGGRRVFQSKEAGDPSGAADPTRLSKGRQSGLAYLDKPRHRPGDTTPWMHHSGVLRPLLTDRFGDTWHLSPEQSLLLHAENTSSLSRSSFTVQGTNNTLALLFDTPSMTFKHKQMPPAADLVVKEGLRLFFSTATLIRCQTPSSSVTPFERSILQA